MLWYRNFYRKIGKGYPPTCTRKWPQWAPLLTAESKDPSLGPKVCNLVISCQKQENCHPIKPFP